MYEGSFSYKIYWKMHFDLTEQYLELTSTVCTAFSYLLEMFSKEIIWPFSFSTLKKITGKSSFGSKYVLCQGRRNRGKMGEIQILADKLTLFQSGICQPHYHSPTPPAGFSDLPTALYVVQCNLDLKTLLVSAKTLTKSHNVTKLNDFTY